MNYLLFANPQTGSPILSDLMRVNPPSVVVTRFAKIDSWKRVAYRFLTGKFTVEDKMRFFYKKEFHEYSSINRESLKKIIMNNGIEIGFITTFSYKIPNEFISLFPKGLYNLHPSLLPKYKGANPIQEILQSNEIISGTTCHAVTEIFDTGEIYYQTKFEVRGLNERSLLKRYQTDCIEIIEKMIRNFEDLRQKKRAMPIVNEAPH